jgi:hypothetical protein
MKNKLALELRVKDIRNFENALLDLDLTDY